MKGLWVVLAIVAVLGAVRIARISDVAERMRSMPEPTAEQREAWDERARQDEARRIADEQLSRWCQHRAVELGYVREFKVMGRTAYSYPADKLVMLEYYDHMLSCLPPSDPYRGTVILNKRTLEAEIAEFLGGE